jgi:hypothetical protein
MVKKIFILITIIIIYYFIYNYANDIEIVTIDSMKTGPTILLIGSVHGNEPAGSVALYKFMNSLKNNNIQSGKLFIIPCPNKLGLLFNSRWLLHRLNNRDLNRNFPRNEREIALDPISTKIMEYVIKSDLIIDFHEGWGFHKINPESMGSGIYPGDTKFSIVLANELLNNVNQYIQDPIKKFSIVYNKHPDIKSLKNFANYLGKDYILVETSGQDNIQPMDLRVKQDLQIIQYSLTKLGVL